MFRAPNTASSSHNSMSLFTHSSLPCLHKEHNIHIQVACKGLKMAMFVLRTSPSLIALQRCVRLRTLYCEQALVLCSRRS